MNKKNKTNGQSFETIADREQINTREQKQVSKSLINSEKPYQCLFETAKDGILILDSITAKIVDANSYIVEILEYPLENIIGKQLWEIGLFRNKEESKQIFNELKEGLTESLKQIRRMNEDLASANVKAEESDNLKSAFLANISHEIYNPMNAIIGFSDILMTSENSEVKTAQFIQIINTSCKQLLSVINDIIDISKIETDQIIINKTWVNLNPLLQDIFNTYIRKVYSKKIKLIYCNKPEFHHIQTKTDLNKVKQILCNLLNNAIQYTLQGEVRFGFDVKGNFIEFYVKDSGIGIDSKHHAIIFDRFRQVENTYTRMYEGNGLGLTISKALVEKLGGTISVDSEPGKGSIFVFTIPYLKNSITKKNARVLFKINSNN